MNNTSTFHNTTDTEDDVHMAMTTELTVIGSIICVILLAVGLCGNTLMVTSIVNVPSLKKKENVLIASLCVCCNLYLLTKCPVILYIYINKLTHLNMTSLQCLVFRWFDALFPLLCALHVFSITLSHFLLIVAPICSHQYSNKKYVIGFLLFLYVFFIVFTGVLLVFLPMHWNHTMKFDTSIIRCINLQGPIGRTLIYTIVAYLVALISMSMMHFVIYRKVKKSLVKVCPSPSSKSTKEMDTISALVGSISDTRRTSSTYLQSPLYQERYMGAATSRKLNSSRTDFVNRMVKQRLSQLNQLSQYKREHKLLQRKYAIIKSSVVIILMYTVLIIPYTVVLEVYLRNKVSSPGVIMPFIMLYVSSFSINWIVFGTMNKNFHRANERLISKFKFC